MEFMRLGSRSGIEFRVGNGYCCEAGDNRQKGFLFGTEWTFAPRINQDRPLSGGGPERSGEQRPRRHEIAKRVACGIDGHIDWFSGRNRAIREVGSKVKIFTI